MFSTFSQKIIPFYEVMSKNMANQKLQMTIWRLVICWISKATCAQAHVLAFALTHIHTHTTYARPHARTHENADISSTYFYSTATIAS
jgi:hypothetical protein